MSRAFSQQYSCNCKRILFGVAPSRRSYARAMKRARCVPCFVAKNQDFAWKISSAHRIKSDFIMCIWVMRHMRAHDKILLEVDVASLLRITQICVNSGAHVGKR